MENFVYGKNPVEELLKDGKRNINKIFIAQGTKHDDKVRKIISLARESGVIVQEVPREKINTLVDGVHQGVVASVSCVEYIEIDELIDNMENQEGDKLVVILDKVEDPHNLGAIIRTAAAAGANGIIIPKRRCVPVTSTVEKASAGNIDKISICQTNNLANAIEKLQNNGFWVVAAEASGTTKYFEYEYGSKCAIVMGGENSGVGSLVQKKCDVIVNIPIYNEVNSLNVSNAASILIYEVIRQRHSKK